MSIQWTLVLFTVLTGMGGWILCGAFVDSIRKKNSQAAVSSVIIAIIAMVIGGLASVAHLGHPERMFAALGHPTSGIFTEAVLVGIAVVAAAIYLLIATRKGSPSAQTVFLAVAAIAGVVLSFMAGDSYIMPSAPAWNTIFLPIGYLGTAAVCGISAYALIVACRSKGKSSEEVAEVSGNSDLALWPKIIVVAGAVAFVTALIYAVVSDGFGLMPLLWALCLVFSGAVPVICGCVALRKSPESATGIFAIAVCSAVIGAIIYRCAMWLMWVPIDNFFSIVL